jgi:MFS transporter, PHS family, inorganic phosphate transporter
VRSSFTLFPLSVNHADCHHAAWRIVVGLSLIPAFGTLYQRLTLGESTRYTEASKLGHHRDTESLPELKARADADVASADSSTHTSPNLSEKPPNAKTQGAVVERDASAAGGAEADPTRDAAALKAAKRAHWREFFVYFSQWRHLRVLLGTALSWFLLDIAFYGINLNQNVVLQEIHFDGKSGEPWERLFRIAVGNLIITALGFVPGYYVTVLTIEYLGRKWIQIQGFLLEALFCTCPASTDFVSKR